MRPYSALNRSDQPKTAPGAQWIWLNRHAPDQTMAQLNISIEPAIWPLQAFAILHHADRLEAIL